MFLSMKTTTNKATDHTNLRDRKGRYSKECAFCGCPDGCACDGEGCPCGTDKKRGASRLSAMVAAAMKAG